MLVLGIVLLHCDSTGGGGRGKDDANGWSSQLIVLLSLLLGPEVVLAVALLLGSLFEPWWR